MQISIDNIQSYILRHTKTEIQKGKHYGQLSANDVYDMEVDFILNKFVSQCLPDLPVNERLKYKSMFSDALWDLSQRGILKLGRNFFNQNQPLGEMVGGVFSLTEYGRRWIEGFDDSSIVPAYPDAFIQTFDKYQSLYGGNFFRRAQEAVRCFQSRNYLACCVMCGAASESILLSMAFEKIGQVEALKLYNQTSGRRNLKNALLKDIKPNYIQDQYDKFTSLIDFWRDQSGHGHDSDINADEAYISLVTLLRFATFIKTHQNEILNKSTIM